MKNKNLKSFQVMVSVDLEYFLLATTEGEAREKVMKDIKEHYQLSITGHNIKSIKELQ